MKKWAGAAAAALLVLAACGGGNGDSASKMQRTTSPTTATAPPTASASTTPAAPGQLEVTFGDAVPYTPPPGPRQLQGVFNENHAPVAVDTTITNRGDQTHPGVGFWLFSQDGSKVYGLTADLADPILGEIPPGGTVQGQVIFGPLKMSGRPVRVEAQEIGELKRATRTDRGEPRLLTDASRHVRQRGGKPLTGPLAGRGAARWE